MVETLNEEYAGRIFLDEKEFPDDLEGRMSSVLNAVNTELKTVTLLHLDDRPADSIEIRDRIRDTRGEGYLPHVKSLDNYGNTLHDIALVAKQTVVRDNGETQILGHSLTEAGKKYGVLIAEHALKWGVDNDLSMYQIFGSTSSSGKTRSPENRVRMLEVLSTGKASEGELADFLDIDHGNVIPHVQSLSKIGFVKFDSAGNDRVGFSKYVWVDGKSPEDVEAVRGQLTLTRKVTDEMSKGLEFDYRVLAKILGCKSSGMVSRTLAGLERQGFLKRKSVYQAKVVMSEMELLESGERFLEEVIYPIQEHLSEGAVLETDFEGRFPEYVSRGIGLYGRVSPHMNRKNPLQRIHQIERYLSKSLDGATSEEIAESLGVRKNIVLRYLSRIDDIRIKKESQKVLYFLDDGSGGEE